jgi:hypothetical protein
VKDQGKNTTLRNFPTARGLVSVIMMTMMLTAMVTMIMMMFKMIKMMVIINTKTS